MSNNIHDMPKIYESQRILTFASSIIHVVEALGQAALATWALPIALGQIYQLLTRAILAGAPPTGVTAYFRFSGPASHARVPCEDSASLVLARRRHCETGVNLFRFGCNCLRHGRLNVRLQQLIVRIVI